MTQEQVNKIKKRIARQQAKANDAMSGYSSGKGRKGSKRTHAKGNLWKHNDLPRAKADIAIWYK